MVVTEPEGDARRGHAAPADARTRIDGAGPSQTYFLVILGTFTTRSGVLESVHSFARSEVGPYFLGFLIIILFGFLWLLFDRLPLLRGEHTIDSYSSREAAFLANMLN